MKRIVAEGLGVVQRRFGVCLIGYVIMPEHLHVIIYPHSCGKDEPTPISQLLHAFKKHVGFHGKQRLREIWRAEGGLWSQPLNAWATDDKKEQSIWNARGYDFNVRTHKALLQKLEYCHKNPVARGLVDHPEDWRWSSYRYYEFGDQSVLKMGLPHLPRRWATRPMVPKDSFQPSLSESRSPEVREVLRQCR